MPTPSRPRDYTLSSENPTDGEPYVLRIWCCTGEGSRPFGAERLASILVPSIEKWLSSSLAIGHAVRESSGSYEVKDLDAVRETAG